MDTFGNGGDQIENHGESDNVNTHSKGESGGERRAAGTELQPPQPADGNGEGEGGGGGGDAKDKKANDDNDSGRFIHFTNASIQKKHAKVG